MADINTVTVTGRLTNDVDLRYTAATQKAVATVSLAVSNGFGDNQKTIFPEIQLWTHTAEFVERYAKKGTQLTVTGFLDEQTWTDKDTQKQRKKTIIVAKNVVIGRASGEATTQEKVYNNNDEMPSGFSAVDDDIPF